MKIVALGNSGITNREFVQLASCNVALSVDFSCWRDERGEIEWPHCKIIDLVLRNICCCDVVN